MKRFTWLLVVIYLAATTATTVESAGGLGEQVLWASDTGQLQSDGANQDALFIATEGCSDEGEKLTKEYEQVVRKVKIELVAPSKDLSNVMNTIVTKSKAKFLQEYDHYYKSLKVDSISRPMLYSYLYLTLLNQEQINQWYEPVKRRVDAKVTSSCMDLARLYHEKVDQLDQKDLDIVERSKFVSNSKNQLAYSIFHSNLNLFMINNYLLLCSRLHPQLFDQQFKWLL